MRKLHNMQDFLFDCGRFGNFGPASLFFPFPVPLYVVCLIVVGVSQDEPVLDPGNPGDLRE